MSDGSEVGHDFILSFDLFLLGTAVEVFGVKAQSAELVEDGGRSRWSVGERAR